MDHLKSLLATTQGAPIALEVRNTFRLATVALGQLAASPFDPASPDHAFELDIVPVPSAYVLCLQRTLGGQAIQGSLPIRWGRTNDLGWILEPEEGRLYEDVAPAGRLPSQTLFGEPVGDELPVPAKDQMLLEMGESYDLYWTFDRERFEEAAAEVQKGQSASPVALPCHRVGFQPRFPHPIEGLDLLEEGLRLRVSHFLLRAEDQGYVVGRQYGQELCLFDVTPEPLRALYLCEFLQWWSITAMKASAKDLATLVRARNLAEASHHGSPDIDMEAQFNAKPGSPEREVLDHYRDYVWQCAANGVSIGRLGTTLDVSVASLSDEQPAWQKDANTLSRQTGGRVCHPGLRKIPRERLLLGSSTRSALLDYFQLYQFGGRLKRRGISGRITCALEELAAECHSAGALLMSILSKHASHSAVIDAVQWGVADISQLRLELLDRYFTICGAAEYAWWRPLEGYSADNWKAFASRLKWIAALPGGFADAFKNFFGRRLQAYKLAGQSANEALTTFYRYHAASVGRLHAPAFEESLPVLRTKVRVDFRASTITVLGAYDGTARLNDPLELMFTTVEQSVPPAGLAAPAGMMTKARKRRFDLAKEARQVVEYDVELPVDIKRAQQMGAQMPAVLALACGALNTLFGTIGAMEQLKLGSKVGGANVEAWYELGKNTLGVVDSLASLQDALAPKVEGYSPLLQRLSPALTRAACC